MRRLLAVAACLLPFALPHAAPASSAPVTGLADDRVLLGEDGAAAQAAVERWSRLGVGLVRIQARWIAIAPAPLARTRPRGFRPGDHRDRRYNWGRLDRAVDLLEAAGIDVVLTVTGSGPLWTSAEPARRDPRWKPKAAEFGAFARAVATRFRGRVAAYAVWNEPNHPAWLQPQYDCARRGCPESGPRLYRALLHAGGAAIRRADPDAEVLTGGLAPIGRLGPRGARTTMRPLRFLRAVACLDVSGRRRVREAGCRKPLPVDGVGYHPHAGRRAPTTHAEHRDDATIADLPRVLRAVDVAVRRGTLRSRTGAVLPLWLIEFGYQTATVRGPVLSPAMQALWTAQATKLAHESARIACLVQYSWQDEPLDPPAGVSKARYKGWQSGLIDERGREKPALRAFALPLVAERIDGRSQRLWGQMRRGRGTVLLERRSTTGRWVEVARRATDARGVWSVVLADPAPGSYRFRPLRPDVLDLPASNLVRL